MRQGVFSVVVTLVVAAGARADRMAGSRTVVASTRDACALAGADCREILLFGLSDPVPTPADLCLEGNGLPQEAPAVAHRTVDSEAAIVLTDSRGSLDLCLYTLISLGLFRSGHRVRRSSLGFVPEWYHSGGPHQSGRSHALGPDAVCHAVVCFVQGDAAADRWILHSGRRGVPSRRCISQFVPAVLACRAPPYLS